MTLLSVDDFKGLIAPIILNQYHDRWLDPLSFPELKERFPGLTGLTYHNGNQVLHFGDKLVEVSPMASFAEIEVAIQNPFVPTKNTTVKMAKSPLQGLGQKLGLAKHNAELDAQQISAKVDELEARRAAATPKVMAGLEAQGQDIGELEAFVSDLEKASNQ